VKDNKDVSQVADCVGQQRFRQSNVQLCVFCLPIVQHAFYLSVIFAIGEMYATKNSGPNTLPCGTYGTQTVSDYT